MSVHFSIASSQAIYDDARNMYLVHVAALVKEKYMQLVTDCIMQHDFLFCLFSNSIDNQYHNQICRSKVFKSTSTYMLN